MTSSPATHNSFRALNLGCGTRIHAQWDNIDFVSSAPSVRAHDLRKGIPYPDTSCDAVYHSHVLEHLDRPAARAFLLDCKRVLKSGGIIRVAVPDLEAIARLYLQALDSAVSNVRGASDNYRWIMLELYDQTVREMSCGAMADYFRQKPFPNWDFVFTRFGTQATILRDAFTKTTPADPAHPSHRAWGYVLRNPLLVIKNRILRLLLGDDEYRALEIARFRNSGEIHKWMYDRYSLSQLLTEVGFQQVQQRGPAESSIPGWRNFNLDTEPDGTTYKPDSIYMEAVRP